MRVRTFPVRIRVSRSRVKAFASIFLLLTLPGFSSPWLSGEKVRANPLSKEAIGAFDVRGAIASRPQATQPSLQIEGLAADLTLFGPPNSFLSNNGVRGGLAVGDFNGDGIKDLLVGARGLSGGRELDQPFAGGAFIIYGGSIFAQEKVRDLGTSSADVVIRGIDAFDNAGVVAAGDVNGDGIDDIVIGVFNSQGADNHTSSTGEVDVIYGSNHLPSEIKLAVSPPDAIIYGRRLDSLGFDMAIGDLNGDGLADLILGASSALGPGDGRHQDGNPVFQGPGAVYVIFGKPVLPKVIDLAQTSADVTVFGENGGDNMGDGVGVGDLNGDGVADLIVGAGGAKGPDRMRRVSSGQAYVVYGKAELPAIIDAAGDVGPKPDVVIYGGEGGVSQVPDPLGDGLGSPLAVGDINGDGIDDLLIGANRAGDQIGRPQAGAVYIVFGGVLPPVIDVEKKVGPPPDVTIWGAQGSGSFRDDFFSQSLVSADVNDDGIDDILVVAENGDGPFQRINDGDVYVIYGGSLQPVMDMRGELGDSADVIIYSGSGSLNTSPKWLKVAAGDLDGDRINELIVGAPLTSIPPFGSPEGRESAGAVFVFSIPRLAAIEPLTITTARYRGAQQTLEVTVPGATAEDKIEINGRLVGPFWNLRVPIIFDASGSKFIVSGKKKVLLLNKGKGTNTVVVIHEGVRSAAFTF